MPLPSLVLKRSDLLRHLGRSLGWARDPGSWDTRQQMDGDDIVADALRQFYSPPLLPGERTQHQWAFLYPWGVLSTSANQPDYLLPEDFAGLHGDSLVYLADNGAPCPIYVTTDVKVRRQQQGMSTQTGYPHMACIIPQASGGQTSQRWQLTLYPTPDGDYELRYRYRSNPYNITESTPYPLGGQPMADALLASVLAAAESKLDDKQDIRYIEFIQKLQAAVASDRANTVSSLGIMHDPSVNRDSEPYSEWRSGNVTLYYNGVEL